MSESTILRSGLQSLLILKVDTMKVGPPAPLNVDLLTILVRDLRAPRLANRRTGQTPRALVWRDARMRSRAMVVMFDASLGEEPVECPRAERTREMQCHARQPLRLHLSDGLATTPLARLAQIPPRRSSVMFFGLVIDLAELLSSA